MAQNGLKWHRIANLWRSGRCWSFWLEKIAAIRVNRPWNHVATVPANEVCAGAGFAILPEVSAFLTIRSALRNAHPNPVRRRVLNGLIALRLEIFRVHRTTRPVVKSKKALARSSALSSLGSGAAGTAGAGFATATAARLTPGKLGNRTNPVLGLHISGTRVSLQNGSKIPGCPDSRSRPLASSQHLISP